MKTDLKIGVVLGIIVVIVVIIYYANKPQKELTGPVASTPAETKTDLQGPLPPPAEADKQLPKVSKTISTPNKIVIKAPSSEKAPSEQPLKTSEPIPVAEPRPPRYHTVTQGESLYAIAEQYYGDGLYWKDIYQANKNVIKDPNLLQAGWKLRIPYSDELAKKYQP